MREVQAALSIGEEHKIVTYPWIDRARAVDITHNCTITKHAFPYPGHSNRHDVDITLVALVNDRDSLDRTAKHLNGLVVLAPVIGGQALARKCYTDSKVDQRYTTG